MGNILTERQQIAAERLKSDPNMQAWLKQKADEKKGVKPPSAADLAALQATVAALQAQVQAQQAQLAKGGK